MIAKLIDFVTAGPLLRWVTGFFEEGTSGARSAKRLALIMGAASMSSAVIILARKAAPGHDVSGALWAVTTPLAALGGASYVWGKHVERKNQPPAPGAAPEAGGGAP